MLLPAGVDDGRIEEAVFLQAILVEQVFRPSPERAPDPFADGNAEAGLGPLEQRPRRLAIKEAAEDLLSADAADLHLDRDPRRDGGDMMIEELNTSLQAHRHGGPIDFAEDVVGEVGDGVAIHHPDGVRGACPRIHIEPALSGDIRTVDHG